MNQREKDVFAELDAAVAAWNARAGAAWPEVMAGITAAQSELEAVTAVLAQRKSLSRELLVARAKLDAVDQTPEERQAAVAEIVRRLSALGKAFAAFEETLPLLRGQAQRAAHKAQDLRDGLAALQLGPEPDTAVPNESNRLSAQLRALRQTLADMHGPPDESTADAEELPATPTPQDIESTAAIEEAPPATDNVPTQYERLRQHAADALGNARPLGRILLDAGIINEEQLETALEEQQTAWRRHLGAILVELGFTSEEAIAQTLAAQTKHAYVELNAEDLPQEALRLVPGRLAARHTCVPIRASAGTLTVAMANPLDLIAIEDLQLATNRHIEPVAATARRIRAAIQRHYYGKR